jgi:H+/Cl- antiporter ClcA
LAAGVGLVGATAGQFFLLAIDRVREFILDTLPEAIGFDSPPWWYLSLGLILSAVIVLAARRLPGATGRGPLTGFHFDDPLRTVPGVLIAAAATLLLGASLGPEAPTIVVGTTIGALLLRRGSPTTTQLAMFIGGIAAIGSIFGNPFIAAFMVLEFVVVGMAPRVLALPAFVALGSGYLAQVGWNSVPGLGVPSLSVPGLPQYATLQGGDLLVGLVLAVVVALLTLLTRSLGNGWDRLAQQRPALTLLAGAVVTAVVASVAILGFGVDVQTVLYSGQSGIPLVIAETSLATVIVILIARLLVYSTALGSGFRGGPIFPACFLGVTFGVAVHLLLPHVAVSPMAAVGIAAASAAMTGLTFTSGALSMLLIGGAGLAIAPFAIVGAVVGGIVRQVVTSRQVATKAAASATGG